VAADTAAFAFENGLALRQFARGKGAAGGGLGHVAEVGDNAAGLEIVKVVRRHGGAVDAFLDDADQVGVGGGAAELAVPEVRAGNGIAFGTVTRGAIGNEEALAVLDFAGSVTALGDECAGRQK
jgi:hypothetical protein